ncbi:Hypothetical protein NTJ_03023 [Nesidiocoris tenuis]|uniref:LicD/FKTN/FKRP nucleotidyltransferase domain-containing protein n=1 Tax=Nesidiocoris tenuis TaxID=355587 RepID=A0ABN7AD63_9HEMI|nr:Hypothetical protein NTJ_03023 [Nesidiocoris tenuis]
MSTKSTDYGRQWKDATTTTTNGNKEVAPADQPTAKQIKYLTSLGISEAIGALDEVAHAGEFPVFLIDPSQLRILNNDYSLTFDDSKTYNRPVSFAFDCSLLNGSDHLYRKVVPAFLSRGFKLETIVDTSADPLYPEWPIAILAKIQTTTFHIRTFHVYEDNGWWFASWNNDANCSEKILRFGIDLDHVFTEEGHLSKFRLTRLKLNGEISRKIWVPKYPAEFIEEFAKSKFLRCEASRHSKKDPISQSNQAIRFRHEVRKILSVVRAAFDGIHLPFWISSGTLLGYFRHCDVIPHSKDVDIGVFADDYTHHLVTSLEKHGLKLHLWFGEINDSLELSFVSGNGLKLDIFFFYRDKETMWNGGTQLRTGKKFRYDFSKFELCWTLFLGLKVRVPCNTENYIVSNYGPSWQVPVEKWDWKTSPYNVRENGEWPLNRLRDVIKVFS